MQSWVSGCEAYVNRVAMQGWVPRSGLQYGVDLVLYEQHPSLVHSTTCVTVVPMKPPGMENTAEMTDPEAMLNGQNGSLSWQDVEGINRLCIRVGCACSLLTVLSQLL